MVERDTPSGRRWLRASRTAALLTVLAACGTRARGPAGHAPRDSPNARASAPQAVTPRPITITGTVTFREAAPRLELRSADVADQTLALVAGMECSFLEGICSTELPNDAIRPGRNTLAVRIGDRDVPCIVDTPYTVVRDDAALWEEPPRLGFVARVAPGTSLRVKGHGELTDPAATLQGSVPIDDDDFSPSVAMLGYVTQGSTTTEISIGLFVSRTSLGRIVPPSGYVTFEPMLRLRYHTYYDDVAVTLDGRALPAGGASVEVPMPALGERRVVLAGRRRGEIPSVRTLVYRREDRESFERAQLRRPALTWARACSTMECDRTVLARTQVVSATPHDGITGIVLGNGVDCRAQTVAPGELDLAPGTQVLVEGQGFEASPDFIFDLTSIVIVPSQR